MVDDRQPLTLKTMLPLKDVRRETGLNVEGDTESGVLRADAPNETIEIESTIDGLRLGRVVGGVFTAVLIGLFALSFWYFIGRVEGAWSGLSKWFPPWFNGFNAWLLLAATAIPATVTLSYIFTMKAEKTNRLYMQFKGLPPFERTAVHLIIEDMFRLDRYLGAITAPTLVTFLGAIALLFFKPVFGGEVSGVDFTGGGNLLMLGTAVEFAGKPDKFREVLYVSTAAFTFGFLGAWLYFITDLTRSFFNCDLRPRTLIAGAIRMTSASLIALLVGLTVQAGFGGVEVPGSAAFLGSEGEPSSANAGLRFVDLIVPMAFIIGFFPDRGLGFINAVVGWISRLLAPEERNVTPLGVLPGMSYSHSQRLRLEGIDGVENLAGHHPVMLTLQTGFPYPVIEAWVGEAWLRRMIGNETHADFAAKTGLRGKYELRRLAWRLAEESAADPDKPTRKEAATALEAALAEAMGDEGKVRMGAIARLCLYFDNWGGADGKA